MKRLQEELQSVLFACAVLLMLGWFIITTTQISDNLIEADSNITQIGVPVLMYHHLLPESEITGLFANNNVVVSTEQFQHDIAVLKEQGYQTISLRQLEAFVRNGAEVPLKSVVITFDDGYLSNKIYAMPILQEADYTAVIFSLTGWMEEKPQTFRATGLQYLSWQEIWQMRNVFQFASHTDNLHQLGWNGKGNLTTGRSEEITADIRRSIKKLRGTNYFSYPYGHYNTAVQTILEQQGILLAFTVSPGHVHAGDNPMALNRWDMYQYSIEEVLHVAEEMEVKENKTE